ncbi:MAG: hypothetical protein HW406_465 [Candidatus Brocadiaceae bacterium]|nr:hypothetical protein [Candidatus Brocadiaceae bacterium]
MLDKIEKTVMEKSDKIMTNEKVEKFVNNMGGMLCFIGAVVFGIMFIVGGASLMKTGKNYVVKPSKEEKHEAEASAESTEAAATEEAAHTEEAPAESSAE